MRCFYCRNISFNIYSLNFNNLIAFKIIINAAPVSLKTAIQSVSRPGKIKCVEGILEHQIAVELSKERETYLSISHTEGAKPTSSDIEKIKETILE